MWKFWSGVVGPCVALAFACILGVNELPSASADESPEPPRSRTLEDKDSGFRMEFVLIPAAREKGFFMGSTDRERAAVTKQVTGKGVPRWPQEEGPRHKVVIAKAFYLGKYEVTQKQYRAIVGKNAAHFSHKGTGRDKVKDVKEAELDEFPVEMVSWKAAESYLTKLNELFQKQQRRYHFRLPTEAEWEYACRAGADVEEAFTFEKPSDSISHEQANFNSRSPFGGGKQGKPLDRTCKVGTYKANPFGLHDMHGNVREWCSDWHAADTYKEKNRKDPLGPSVEQRYRVVRGGAWGTSGINCRSAQRGSSGPGDGQADVGFRVVCVTKD